jgi:hypothetical protein
VVEVLLSRGANQELAANDGSTALSRARGMGHSDIVQLLSGAVQPDGDATPLGAFIIPPQ